MSLALPAVDAVRLLCGDSYGDAQVLQDEEVSFFLDECGGNRYEAAAACADAIAARYAARVDVRVGILSTSDSQLSGQFRRLAADLRSRAASLRNDFATPWAGGISMSEKERMREDADITPPAFVRSAPSGWEDEQWR